MGQNASCQCNSGALEDKLGQYYVTPYGIGREVNPDSATDIKQVKLAFGNVFIHSKHLKNPPQVSTTYGKGVLIEKNDEFCVVELDFGTTKLKMEEVKELSEEVGPTDSKLLQTAYLADIQAKTKCSQEAKSAAAKAVQNAAAAAAKAEGAAKDAAEKELALKNLREEHKKLLEAKRVADEAVKDAVEKERALQKLRDEHNKLMKEKNSLQKVADAANASAESAVSRNKDAEAKAIAASKDAEAKEKALKQLREEHAKLLAEEKKLKDDVTSAKAIAAAEAAKAAKAAAVVKDAVSASEIATAQEVAAKESILQELRKECADLKKNNEVAIQQHEIESKKMKEEIAEGDEKIQQLEKEKIGWTAEKKSLKQEIMKLKASLKRAEMESAKLQLMRSADPAEILPDEKFLEKVKATTEESILSKKEEVLPHQWIKMTNWSAFTSDITKQFHGVDIWKVSVDSISSKSVTFNIQDGLSLKKRSSSFFLRATSDDTESKSDLGGESSVLDEDIGRPFIAVTIADGTGNIVGKPAQTLPGDLTSTIYILKGSENEQRFIFIQLKQLKRRKDGSCYSSEIEFTFLDLDNLDVETESICRLPLHKKPVSFTRDPKKIARTGGSMIVRMSVVST
mmetsp:Transcript_45043/g.72359  ORF Transcript_45043/g.72359 Transcript_45043/m.72359 type:complete len:626 (+) Transcript_45043:58-1935(+)